MCAPVGSPRCHLDQVKRSGTRGEIPQCSAQTYNSVKAFPLVGKVADSLANRSEGASYPIMLRSPRKNTAVGTLCPLSRLLQRSVASDSSPKALCALGEPLNSERSDLQLITLNS